MKIKSIPYGITVSFSMDLSELNKIHVRAHYLIFLIIKFLKIFIIILYINVPFFFFRLKLVWLVVGLSQIILLWDMGL